jgi:hypothetical protein
MGLLQILVARLRKTRQQHGSKLILPQQINYLFVGKYRIPVSESGADQHEQQEGDDSRDDLSS